MGTVQVESPVQESLRTQLHRVVSPADTWSLPAAPVDTKSTGAALRPPAVPAASQTVAGLGCGVWIASHTHTVRGLGFGLGFGLGLGFWLGLHTYLLAS